MRLRNLIPTTAKLVLFKSAILPYLTYCHLVWHFCRASDTRRLERIQERGLRAVYKDTKSSYHQLLNRANLPTLLNRRLQDICVLSVVPSRPRRFRMRRHLSSLSGRSLSSKPSLVTRIGRTGMGTRLMRPNVQG